DCILARTLLRGRQHRVYCAGCYHSGAQCDGTCSAGRNPGSDLHRAGTGTPARLQGESEAGRVMHEQLTVIGALIALVYVSVISSILWWMLHVPKVGDVEQHVKRTVREQSRFARILVPVQADVVSDRIVALASQMAKF